MSTAPATRHGRRTVRVFALYRTATDGEHFGIVRSGAWAEVVEYLNCTARFAARQFFVEGSDGALRSLMATGSAA